MRPRQLALLACVGGVALWGCNLVLGLDGPAGSAPTPFVLPVEPDAPPDAGLEASATDPCAASAPPGPPDQDDDPKGALPATYFVAKTMQALSRDGLVANIDLDGFRTCGTPGPGIKTGSSCVRQGNRIDAAAPCDTDQCGGDNSFSLIANGLDDVFLGGVELSAATGLKGVLLYFAGYNGRANDRDVTVGFAGTSGIYSDIGCDGLPRGRTPSTFTNVVTGPDGGLALAYPSSFDDCDRWCVEPKIDVTIEPDGTLTPLRTVRAYVRDHILVVRGLGALPFGLGDIVFDIASPIVTARVDAVTNDAGQQVVKFTNIQIAGRMTLDNLLPVLGSMKFQGQNTTICNQRTLYEAIALEVCAAADLASNDALDGKGKACDSVSIGLTAEVARVSPVLYPDGYAVRSRGSGCPAGTLLTGEFCQRP
jgi:hypothetical protein